MSKSPANAQKKDTAPRLSSLLRGILREADVAEYRRHIERKYL